MPGVTVGGVQAGALVVALAAAKLPGPDRPPLAAISEGLTGEPTLPGVAIGVDWNGLRFQKAKLGIPQLPPEQPERVKNVTASAADTDRTRLVRMASVPFVMNGKSSLVV